MTCDCRTCLSEHAVNSPLYASDRKQSLLLVSTIDKLYSILMWGRETGWPDPPYSPLLIPRVYIASPEHFSAQCTGTLFSNLLRSLGNSGVELPIYSVLYTVILKIHASRLKTAMWLGYPRNWSTLKIWRLIGFEFSLFYADRSIETHHSMIPDLKASDKGLWHVRVRPPSTNVRLTVSTS